MSKSLGNFITIRELLQEHHGESIRLAMLLTHYRQPINWTASRLSEARQELVDWVSIIPHSAFEELRKGVEVGQLTPDEGVLEALADDLNTVEAVTRLRELFSETKKNQALATKFFSTCYLLGVLSPRTLGSFHPGAAASGAILVRYKSEIERLKVARANRLKDDENRIIDFLGKYGVGVEFRVDGYPVLTSKNESNEIEDLIAARNAARARRDFKESDRIRNELAHIGVVLKDGKDAQGNPVTTWEVAR